MKSTGLIYNVGHHSCYLCGYKHDRDIAHREFYRTFGERCCDKCIRQIRNFQRGKFHSSIFVSHYRISAGYGYVQIKRPYHPFAVNGFVLQHRLIMEDHISDKLGFRIYLAKEYVVHHINGIKNDNRLENLQVMSNLDHSRFHNGKK